MPGLGDSWGTAQELQHPRGPDGRFRNKWKMAEGVVSSILAAISKFNLRTFQSNGQASQYLHNSAKPSRFGGGQGYARLSADYDAASDALRAGSMDASTQKFVKMMDDSATTLDSDVVLHRRVGPEAFGMGPEGLVRVPDMDDEGVMVSPIEDLTGKLMADRAYSSTNIGEVKGTAPVRLSIAVPKGTKVIIPARSQNDPQVYLDRDQEIRITKVKPDGQGGYSVWAIATQRTPGETPAPMGGPGAARPDLAGREGQVEQGRQLGLRGMKVPNEGEAPLHGTPRQRQEQGLAPNPADLQGPVDTGPGGPPPRNEPVVVEALGQGGAPQVTAPPAAAPEVPGGAPATPIREQDFKEAARAVPVPSAGKRRAQWNHAYLGIRSGKRDPDDILRELKKDIEVNKTDLADMKSRGDTSDPQLEEDIAAQEKLAELIGRHHDIDGKTSEEAAPTAEPVKVVKKAAPSVPAKKAAPAKATPTPTPEERQDIAKLDLPTKKEYRALRREGKSHEDALQGARDRNLPPAPAKKATPAKAIAAKAAPAERRMTLAEAKRQTALDAVRENPIDDSTADTTYKRITKGLEDGTMTVPQARKQALDSAKYFHGSATTVGRNGMTTPEKRGQAHASETAKATKYERLAEALQVSQDVTKTDKYRNPRGAAPAAVAKKAVPEAPPAKKVAAPKKSIEGASPGTAAGKITSARLTPGTTVLIRKDSVTKEWRPADRKTGATKLTVTGVDALSGRGGRRQVSGTGPDGEEIKINVAPVQTFIVDTKGDVKSPASGIEDKSTRDFAERVLSGKYILRVGEGQSSDPDSKTNPPELADTPAKKAKALKARAETMRSMSDAKFKGTPNTETEAERIRTFRNAGLLDELADKVHKPPAKKTSRQLETEANNLVGRPDSGPEVTRLRAESRIAGDLEQGRTPDINKMTKPELLAEARRRGVDVRPSWTKDKIKDAIAPNQEVGVRDAELADIRDRLSKPYLPRQERLDIESRLARINKTQSRSKRLPTDDEIMGMTVRELQSIADSEGVPRRGRPTKKVDLQNAIRARREEVANLTSEDQAIIDALGDGPTPAPSVAPSPTPATPSNIMERLSSFDNPPTRDEAHEMLKPLLKRDLLAMAKDLSVPGAQGLTKEKLREEIVEGTAGRRRDSIATRGFRGARPDSPEIPEPLSADPATREIQVENRIREAYRTVLKRSNQSPSNTTFVGLADIRDELGEDFPRPEVDRILLDMTKRSGDPNSPGAVRLVSAANSKALRQRDLDSAIPDPFAPQGPQVGGLHAVAMADPSPRPIPTVVANPVAQKVIQAPDRRSDFDRAWEANGVQAPGSAGRSLSEVMGDVSSGRITPDEGIRRLETEIDLNAFEIADMDETLRGDLTRDERKDLNYRRARLIQGRDAQVHASTFMRKHFKKEPLATPDEVKVELDEAGKRALDEATPEGLRQAALTQGIKVKGETKEEILKDLVRQMAGKELERRATEAKKVAPAPKAPDKPKPNLEQSSYQRIDTQALAEGLDLRTEWDQRMLARVQAQLDGEDTSLGKNPTPAQIGRNLESWANGPAGPFYESATMQVTPEAKRDAAWHARHEAFQAQGKEWRKLADRLKNTRRRKKEDRAPDVTPTVSKDEKKVIADVAEVTGIPAPQLEAKALAKKKAEAPPKQSAVQVAETLKTVGSREEAKTLLQGRTKAELMEIAKATGMTTTRSSDSKPKLIDDIVAGNVGNRLTFEVLTRGGMRGEAGGKPTRADLEDMSLADLVDLEDELGIQRTSLNRGDRIDAILAKQAPPTPAPAPSTPTASKTKPPGPPLRSTMNLSLGEHGTIKVRARPGNDEPVHLPNGGADQGNMHFDSAMGELWQQLYADDREPNSFVNEIAQMGDRMGMRGDADLERDVIPMLERLRERASDSVIQKRIQETIDDLSAPPMAVPDLPEGTPAPIRAAMETLSKIPTARKRGRIGAAFVEEPILQKKAKLIRDFVAGEVGFREFEKQLSGRDLHESADGAYRMWAPFERLFNREPIVGYRQGPGGKLEPITEVNPDYDIVRDWIRATRRK